MTDAPALNEDEERARKRLVELCSSMLSGKLSYFEGAVLVCNLRSRLRVRDDDPDLTAFILIQSETDHLPLQAVRHRWSPDARRKLEPEFEQTEVWAQPFASEACERIIKRFGGIRQQHDRRGSDGAAQQ